MMRVVVPWKRVCCASMAILGVIAAAVIASAESVERTERERVARFAEKAFARMLFSAYFAGDTITPDRSAIAYARGMNGQPDARRDTYTSEWLQWLRHENGFTSSAAEQASYSRFPAHEFPSTESRSLRDWKASINGFRRAGYGAASGQADSSQAQEAAWMQIGEAVVSAGLVAPRSKQEAVAGARIDGISLKALVWNNEMGVPAWRRAERRNGIAAAYFFQAAAEFRGGRTHRAYVLMDEALSDYRRESTVVDSLQSFFSEVTTRARSEDVGRRINRLVEEYRRLDACLLSHARVLERAGLQDAADYTRNRVELEYRLVLQPIIERARAYSESYAFRIPTIDEAAEMALRETIRSQGRFEAGWIGDPGLLEIARSADEPAGYGSAVDAVTHLLDGEAGDDESRKADGPKRRRFTGVLADLNDSKRSFDRWQLDRVLVHRLCGYFSGSDLDEVAGIGDSLPQRFQGGRFVKLPAMLLAEDVREPLAEWIETGDLDVTEGIGGPALAYGFLGWYFMDTGRSGLAQRAFVDGAYASLYGAKPKSLQDLATELNGYRLLVTGAGLGEAPLGALRPAPHLFDEIGILLAAWRANWIKLGGDAMVADAEIAALREAMNAKRRFLESSSRDSSSPRYFLPEYRFSDGYVPEYLVDQLMADQYERFRQVSDDEVCYFGISLALDAIIRDCRLPLSDQLANVPP